MIQNSTSIVADYGVLFGFVFPGVFSIVVPLNVLRMASLVPTRFPLRFLAALKIFVKFEEKDLLTTLTGDLHSTEYRM
jgi:hypothetical protein